MAIYPKRKVLKAEEGTKIPDSIMNKAKDKEVLNWLAANAERFEKLHGIPKMLLSLAGHESGNYSKTAKSQTGVQGLFQFTVKTAKAMGLRVDNEVDERFNLEKATDAAARLLKENIARNKGDIVKGLAEYNGGILAAGAIDSPYDFDSDNGNPGELYGFLRGVGNYAKEWGNTELYNQVNPYVDRAKQAIIARQNVMIKNGIDVKADGNWDRDQYANWKKLTTENPNILNPNVGIGSDPDKGLDVFAPRNSQLPFTSAFDKPRGDPKKTSPDRPAEPEKINTQLPITENKTPTRPADEIRVYENKGVEEQGVKVHEDGGKLVQLEGEGEGGDATPLQGEERIYSIADTKKIVDLANNAESETDLVALGKFVYKATQKQDKRAPEYVEE